MSEQDIQEITDEDLVNMIGTIREDIGMSDVNFRRIKSDGKLPYKWVVPVYQHRKVQAKQIPLERIHALSQGPNGVGAPDGSKVLS